MWLENPKLQLIGPEALKRLEPPWNSDKALVGTASGRGGGRWRGGESQLRERARSVEDKAYLEDRSVS